MTAFNGEKSTNQFLDLLNAVQGASTLAVANTDVVYGKSFALQKNKSFGIMLAFTGTTIDVKVDLEEGNDELSAAEEGSAKSTWAVGTVISSGITSSAARCLAVSPVVARYARLKLTGQGANSANVVLAQATLGISENL